MHGTLINNGVFFNYNQLTIHGTRIDNSSFNLANGVFTNSSTTNNHCGGTVTATVVGNAIVNLPC